MKVNMFAHQSFAHATKRTVLFGWLLLAPLMLYAQQISSSALREKLADAAGDEKIGILHDLTRYYLRERSDSALYFANELRRVAQQSGIDSSETKAARLMGEYYFRIRRDVRKGREWFEKTTELAAKGGSAADWLYALRQIGTILQEQGRTEQALRVFQEAAAKADSLGNPAEQAQNFYRIGDLFRYIEEPARSIPYFRQAQEIWANQEDTLMVNWSFIGMSNAYSKMDSLPKALDLLRFTLQPTYAKFYSVNDSSIVFNNIGRLLVLMRRHTEAEQVLLQTLELRERANSSNVSRAFTYNELLTLFNNQGQYRRALSYGLEAKRLTDAADQIYLRRNILQNLSNAYAGLGDFQQAYRLRLDYEVLEDSIQNKERAAAVAKLELEYQNQKELLEKENQIRLLEKDRQLAASQRNLALGGVLLLGVVAWGLFRWWTSKKRREAETLALKTAQLTELNTAKSRFFANISHELRTPLTLILGPLEAALQESHDVGQEKTRQTMEMVRRNSRKLLALVEEILDLSKLESNKLEVQITTIGFKQFIRRLFSNFESGAELKKIHYHLNYLLNDDLRIQTDRRKLEKIINNLIGNALKFTASSGEVSVTVDEINDKLIIKVKDTGRGIHPDDLPYVFDRYFQSKQPDAPIEGGAGIGLALSKEYALLLGGTLHAKSQWEQGSIFTLEIPKVIAEDPVTVEPEPFTKTNEAVDAESLQAAKPTATLLIVEDNLEMQQYIRETLGGRYALQTVFDGQAAWAFLQDGESRPDLIISDVMMPEMDGFTLLEKLKQDPSLFSIPVVMLTARAEMADKLRALTIGVDDYLTKPFVPDELRVRVKNLLTRVQQRHQPDDEAPKTEEPEKAISPADLRWLQEVEAILHREINNAQYNLFDLSDELALSERQLNRRIKRITGLSPNKYIREIKLAHARQMLESGEAGTVAEAAYAVGFDTPHYFTRLYEERFGKRPADYFS
jgi:signal transduction histidine kinase/DNA-binding response OmpR family regulator